MTRGIEAQAAPQRKGPAWPPTRKAAPRPGTAPRQMSTGFIGGRQTRCLLSRLKAGSFSV